MERKEPVSALTAPGYDVFWSHNAERAIFAGAGAKYLSIVIVLQKKIKRLEKIFCGSMTQLVIPGKKY